MPKGGLPVSLPLLYKYYCFLKKCINISTIISKPTGIKQYGNKAHIPSKAHTKKHPTAQKSITNTIPIPTSTLTAISLGCEVKGCIIHAIIPSTLGIITFNIL